MATGGDLKKPTTRERILHAAMEVFSERGFTGATISEIERRVGLAAGTGSLYKHFSSKEALLDAAVLWEVQRCRAEMVEAHFKIPVTGDPDELRVRMYRQTLHDLRRFHRLFKLMFFEGDRAPALREAIWAALQRPDSHASQREQALDAIANAALGGFYLFSIMQGRPYKGVDEDLFLRILADITRGSVPPDRDRRLEP